MTHTQRRKRKQRKSAPPEAFINSLFDAVFGNHQPLNTVVQYVDKPIPRDIYKKLLFLCHPDKHQQSDVAQEMTRWLLTERERHHPKKGNMNGDS